MKSNNIDDLIKKIKSDFKKSEDKILNSFILDSSNKLSKRTGVSIESDKIENIAISGIKQGRQELNSEETKEKLKSEVQKLYGEYLSGDIKTIIEDGLE